MSVRMGLLAGRNSAMMALCILTMTLAGTVQAVQANMLRFASDYPAGVNYDSVQNVFSVAPDASGHATITLRIMYELESLVLGDSFFDLSASVKPSPGTGTITMTGAVRSAPYLYAPALAGSGVFNLPSQELVVGGNNLSANQGANNPSDMELNAGTYAYADVTFTMTTPLDAQNKPVESRFLLTFSNAAIDDAQASPYSLEAVNTEIVLPEPTALLLLTVGGLTCMRRR